MDSSSRKRGRPKLCVTKEVLEERRAQKRLQNAARRGQGEQPGHLRLQFLKGEQPGHLRLQFLKGEQPGHLRLQFLKGQQPGHLRLQFLKGQQP
ncbi:uncharacterized protein LOC108227531 isoform X3 [Daucus carota subsp. sativus]|uniref:uncharacterized protein LOC108227531 isoform X3 n=1 Tax=Daucus carota subsp. sativus TaxID=79200 RepID=UPI003083A546